MKKKEKKKRRKVPEKKMPESVTAEHDPVTGSIRITFTPVGECSCTPVDLSKLNISVPVEEWRGLSVQNKVCAILGCTCPPVRKCSAPTCGVTYCVHHGDIHPVTVFHGVAWQPVEVVPI